MKGLKALFAVGLLVTCFSAIASADSLIGVSSLGALNANDSYNWAQKGPDGTTLGSSFGATSGLGYNGTVGLAGPDSIIAVQCPAVSCSWTGNFNAGDSLIWTSNGNGGANGPMSLAFGTGVFAAGAYIQEDTPGPFTARITAYNGNTALGSYSVTSDNDGNVVFVGLIDSNGSMTKVVFDLTNCSGFDCNTKDFAIDSVNTNTVPEPSSMVLLASGLVGIGRTIRRRK
ncbi:MAG: hypothetical protein JWO13_2353 [Acidobacteriales bacterium]|nr:hypothetical protein [Terriglobales bacterium]